MTKSPPDRDLTAVLAENLAALNYETLGAADRTQIKRLVLDHVGVCRRGAEQPWCLALREWAGRYVGSGNSVVFGTTLRTAPNVAALVNASAAHGMELDDTHDSSVSHPGAVVIATALALGIHHQASGGEIMAAIAAGYEAMGRAGRAVGASDVIEFGYHPTALFGGFGAAATAGKLLGLDGRGIASAWGLMLSMAGGSMQFSEDPLGTTVKRLHGGYGAHNGILAAEFAALGIAGPSRALDGRYGLGRLFGQHPNFEELARPGGAPLEIHRISMKPYPCCRLFHSTIDALREVTENFSLDPGHISEIRVGGPAIMCTQHMLRRPVSVMAAQYSLPFSLAASLIFGPDVYEAYGEDKFDDVRILSLADKVEAVEDGEMEAAFPEHFGSWVELRTQSGETRRADMLDSIGTPARPMDAAALQDKIAGLLASLKAVPEIGEITGAVETLEQEGGPARLVSLFAMAEHKAV
ncbi:MAG: MmgE/PrpD family protein [Proteobacteria bacterium]|nr:MmgE/PrpD family protein [Pseudomonadota bacterium]